MKSCGYCGRENDGGAVTCRECGTSFAAEVPAPPGAHEAAHVRSVSPRILTASKAGVGVVLILTAIIVIVARITFDLEEAKHGGEIGKPGVFAVGMLAMFYLLPVVAFVIPMLGLACVIRCNSFLIGAATTILAVVSVYFVARPLKMFLPVVLLGRAAGSSVGYYIGAAIQCIIGAWLLGWFDRWLKPPQSGVRSPDEIQGPN